MATNITQRRAPGAVQPFVNLNPAPVTDANRAPTTFDNYEPSTIWIQARDTDGNPVNTIWILASTQNASANWVQLSASGGAGVFSSLTVTPGPISLTGTTSINITGTGTTSIGSGTNNGNVVIGNASATTQSITINSGNAGTGLNINTHGLLTIDSITDIVASPTALAEVNANVGYVTFTGFTTAAAGSQVFTVDCDEVDASSFLLLTVDNAGSNDAQMTITRIEKLAGSFEVTVTNNGAAALNGDLNISFMVLG